MRGKTIEKLILTLGLAVVLTEMLKICTEALGENNILSALSKLATVIFIGWLWTLLVLKPEKKKRDKMEAASVAKVDPISFEKTYRKICDEHGKYLENKRLRERNKALLKYIVLVIGISQILLLAFGGHGLFNKETYINWVIAAIASITYILIDSAIRRTEQKYKDEYKQRVVTALVKSISTRLKFRRATMEDEPYWSEYYLADFGLLNANRIELIDKIEGDYKEKRIDILKINLKNEEIVDGKSVTSDIFEGLFARTLTNNPLNFKLKLCSVGVETRYDISEKGLKKIKLDNGKIMDNFMVEGTDKMLAMRILTSEILEAIVNIKEKYGITLDLIVDNDKVYFLFYTPKMFEPTIWKNAMEKETMSGECSILRLVIDLMQKINCVIADLQI